MAYCLANTPTPGEIHGRLQTISYSCGGKIVTTKTLNSLKLAYLWRRLQTISYIWGGKIFTTKTLNSLKLAYSLELIFLVLLKF